jgi:hypothetical protein
MKKEHWESAGINATRKVARSMIHPDYANRFIREFILEENTLHDLTETIKERC